MSGKVRFQEVLLYAGAFLLLTEWLRPLTVVTDTQEIKYFIIFISFCFLALAFRLPFLFVVLGNIALIFYAMNRIYFEVPFFSSGWLTKISTQLLTDVNTIFHWNLPDLSVQMRTVLLFILLWLMAYLIRYWVFYQKRIVFFFSLTIFYVTILDTFSPYDATFAIVRVVIIGFLLLGFLRMDLKQITHVTFSNIESKKRSIILFIGMLFLSIGIAYIAPKPAAQWSDTVPFFTSYAQNSDGEMNDSSGNQRIGYDVDDSKLGGAFVEDDTVVFTAEIDKPHYWRIETKDLYTGKGWELSRNDQRRPLEGNESLFPQYGRGVTKEIYETTVTFQNPTIHLMHVPDLISIDLGEGISSEIAPTNEKLYPYERGELKEITSYRMKYQYPTFDVHALQTSESVEDPLESNALFTRRYTQLPDQLPERVKKLAQEITADAANRYDKVKEIEDYFQANGYVYNTQDVAIPSEGEDYVDQFLFETMKGYCDNFSTSMVVLLRSVDIPARWVKGYTAGEQIGTDSKKQVYEVTKNNAHSWVEVYFPGTGWVPFETTSSLSNPYDFTYRTQQEPTNPNEEAKSEIDIPKKEEKVEETPKKQEKNETSNSEEKNDSLNFSWSISLISLLSFCLITMLLYLTRFKWILYVLVPFYKKRRGNQVFQQAYFLLLNIIERKGIKRAPDETLREFSLRVDQHLNTTLMSELTTRYERVLYGNDEAEEAWKDSVELWENLIKKVGS
ncbi:DUF4129 domain-containing protein [Priestia megaterium]|nr:DUF4129 domain-containing protein [Priestia megaterium]